MYFLVFSKDKSLSFFLKSLTFFLKSLIFNVKSTKKNLMQLDFLLFLLKNLT